MHLAQDSSAGARSINQRVGAAWGPDEASLVAGPSGHGARLLLPAAPGGRPRILETLCWGEPEEALAGVTSGKPRGPAAGCEEEGGRGHGAEG